jgi:putative transport protein
VTGVLFVGLVAGHFGLTVGGGGQSVGFILFIYCVGVQAGPGFLSAFKEDGLKYGMLAVVIAVTGTILAFGASRFFGFESGMAAGILGGALTSTPTLVAAQDAIHSGTVSLVGVSTTEALSNMSSAYAITYVFGMAGLILFLSFLPRLLRLDVVAEAREYGEMKRIAGGAELSQTLRSAEQPTTRAYRVEREGVIERDAEDFTDEEWTVPGMIQLVKRGEEAFVFTRDMRLERGDIISAVGLETAHDWVRENLGPEIVDYDVIDRSTESRRIMVASKEVAGQSLGEMNFVETYNCCLTRVLRTGNPLPRRPDLQLHLGDVLLFTGPPSELDRLAKDLGFEEKRLEETDLVAFAFGIGLGLIIGGITISIGNIAVGLGTAGGVLLVGLIMGALHARRPDLANLPAGARNVLMELGLLFFMAGVAVNAGTTIVDTFMVAGWQLAVAGITVTLTPVIVAWAVGRYAFKMNGAILLGAITGSMTSTPALKQVQEQARSEIPMLGYVGAYAFGNVLLAIAGALIVRL